MMTMNNFNFNSLTDRLRRINFAMTIDTIEHNGVRFPETPEYVVENYGKYKLANDKLSDLATWQLFCWSVLNEKYSSDKVYVKNFYACLKLNLTSKQQELAFPDDYSDILKDMQRKVEIYKEKKKEYNKSHREEIERIKLANKEKYGTAIINGEHVEVGNVLIENSRIFIGRGDCAYRGGWVKKVEPEDIAINSSKPLPCPIKGHHWKSVGVKNTMSIATYDEYVTVGKKMFKLPTKTIWLSNKNSGKASNDMHKFDKAAEIQREWSKIIKAIKLKASSNNYKDKQVGVCAYLIAIFGIRAGNPSGARNNGVRGASTLLVGDVDLLQDNNIRLHFIGKDSMPFDRTQKIDPIVYDAIDELTSDKDDNDKLFPNITSDTVNKFFQGITKKIPDLNCKNFRTYYGTALLTKEIQKHADEWSEDMSDKQFRSLYDKCVLTVATKLNHKKTLSKEQNAKVDTSTKEKVQKAKEKFKELSKRVDEKIEKLEIKKATLKEKKPRGYLKEVKEINEQIALLRQKIEEARMNFKDIKQEMKDKSDNRDVALNTSKSNYSNPVVAYSLAKYCRKDPKIILSKALVERFNAWINIDNLDENYWIEYPNV